LTSLAFGSLRASLAAYADPHRGGFVSESAWHSLRRVCAVLGHVLRLCELPDSAFPAALRAISSIVHARSTN
jgi:hypothetical protein